MDQDIADKFSVAESRMAALDSRIATAEARLTIVEAEGAKDRTAISDLAKKVDDLTVSQKTQLEILQRLDAVAANPYVKVILSVLAMAAASWAASKGLK